jgi:3-oxoadipate enol-lactonase
MARDRGMSAAIDHWLGSMLFERARRLPAVEAVLQRMARDFDGGPWLRGDPVVLPSPPTLVRLGEIHVPALVLVGEHDHADFHRFARAFADGIPGAELGVVRGAGHLVNMESPATVNALLEAFLSRSLE